MLNLFPILPHEIICVFDLISPLMLLFVPYSPANLIEGQHSIKISNPDDDHLHTDEICKIMYSGPSNVTNQADAFLIDSPDHISWSTINTGNWASKNIIYHDLLHH
jgi:hypothetical protein